MTLVLATVHFGNHIHSNGYHLTVEAPLCGFRWLEVRARKYVLLPVKIQCRAHEAKQEIQAMG